MVFSFILSALTVFAALHSIGSELQIVARLPLPSTHCMQAVCLITFCNLGFLGLQVKTTKRCVCHGRYAFKETRRVRSCLVIAYVIPHSFKASLLLTDYTVLPARRGTYFTHK